MMGSTYVMTGRTYPNKALIKSIFGPSLVWDSLLKRWLGYGGGNAMDRNVWTLRRSGVNVIVIPNARLEPGDPIPEKYLTASIRFVTSAYLLRRAALTKEQEKKLQDLLIKGKGKPIPDDKIHALADEFGMSPHVLESTIYGYASQWAISQKEATERARTVAQSPDANPLHLAAALPKGNRVRRALLRALQRSHKTVSPPS
jgi:hypothetical protein